MGTAAASEPGGKSIQREKKHHHHTIMDHGSSHLFPWGATTYPFAVNMRCTFFDPPLSPLPPLFFCFDVEPELEKCESEWVKEEEHSIGTCTVERQCTGRSPRLPPSAPMLARAEPAAKGRACVV